LTFIDIDLSFLVSVLEILLLGTGMNPISILHLEDSDIDAELIEIMLSKNGLTVDISLCKTALEYLTALEVGGFNLILSDSSIPGFSGRSAFLHAQEKYPQIPFIFVSDYVNEDEAATYLQNGAIDYISKQQLWRLASIIKRTLDPPKTPKIESELCNREMEQLVAVVQKLSLARSLDDITSIVRQAARELTNADGATFVLREGNNCYYLEENAIAPLWKGTRFPIESCISGWCMLNKQPVIIENIYQDTRIPVDAYSPTFVKSLVLVPIRSEAPIGAIGNYWANQHLATKEEVRLLQALGDTISVAMENAQVYNNLESMVRDRTAKLEVANQELEAFAYTLSHDLRSPLTAINGFSTLLGNEYKSQLGENGQHYINRISSSVERMNAQINQVLALHKLKRVEIQPRIVDLSTIAKEILASYQVETIVSQNLTAYGDPILLRVVLENLLSNACKYSSKCSRPRIEFGVINDSQDTQTFYVKDNGVGFNMKYATKLFHPFCRMHSQEEFSGTGVGLASVKRIIDKHGGKIWAEATLNQGATFYFTLPKAPEQESS
jgi:hypothetical protein